MYTHTRARPCVAERVYVTYASTIFTYRYVVIYVYYYQIYETLK